MGHRNTVFAQLTTFLPRSCFEKHVRCFGGDVRVRRFPCWAQLCSMLHAQITGSDSLRDLETSFNAHRSCHYHLGLSEVHRSTVADANEKRSWQIYMQLFYALLDKFKGVKRSRPARIANKICTWDSTMIELCLSVFDWARFRQTKGAIKLHVNYDHGHSIPTVFVVTDGKTHDLTVARRYPVERNSVLLFDRAYTDFAFLHSVHHQGAFFVTRLKSRIRYTVLDRRRVNRKGGITSDQTIRLTGRETRKKYPGPLRRIRYVNPKDGKRYVFLTNNFQWAARTIARLYKCRWQVELFFKWIKQHLKVKTFLGTSLNAVMTQICIAMIAFLLIALIKHRSQSSLSMLEIQRKVKSTLFHRLDLNTVIHGPPTQPSALCENQLLLNLN
jgi:hypothetical protein